MAIILDSICVAHYRSFGAEVASFDRLRDVNVLIGRNNSGKSNLLRLLNLLSLSKRWDIVGFDQQADAHRPDARSPQVGCLVELSGLRDTTVVHHHGAPHSKRYFAEKRHLTVLADVASKSATALGLAEVPREHQIDLFNTLAGNEGRRVPHSVTEKDLERALCDYLYRHVLQHLFSKTRRVLYVPHFRQVGLGSHELDTNTAFVQESGDGIIDLLFKKQNPAAFKENERLQFVRVQDMLAVLFDDPELRLEVPHDKQNLILTLESRRLPLESLGTGVHQMVLLCCAAVLHSKRIFCIEEPELHLHPTLLRRFISLLRSTDNQFFVTTHSNCLIDCADSSTAIFHVGHNRKTSLVTRVEMPKHARSVLDDLQFSASDILQANGVVWVEGPSDRYLLLAWLALVDGSIKEGVHFSVMFTGGALLAHASFDDYIDANESAADLVEMLKLNRNAYVIMDRDCKRGSEDFKPRVSSVRSAMGDRGCWITEGREMENYVSERVLERLRQERFPEASAIRWSADLPLDTSIKRSIGKGAPKHPYASRKVACAKQLASWMTHEDLDTLDLRTRVAALARLIRRWNHLTDAPSPPSP